MKVHVIGAYSESLINFRGDLLKAISSHMHEVIAMAEPCDDDVYRRIKELGVVYQSYPVQRNGMNPKRDLNTLFSLRKAFNKLQPDVVLAYTIKPVIWGGLAFRFKKRDAKFYALITGLGLAFQAGGFKQRILTGLVTFLYRSALAKAEMVIFQNEGNRDVFVDRGIINRERTMLVNGSGVNLEHFPVLPLPDGDLTFLTIARLLGDKGLRELRQAAAILGSQGSEVRDQTTKGGGRRRLLSPDSITCATEDRTLKSDVRSPISDLCVNLLGPDDPSPDGIPLSEVQAWDDSGELNYLGSASDVRPHIAACHVYVLPSYHEGMPRTVLEAMAAGRPIITTDVPGCRETVPLTAQGKIQKERGDAVMEGENGFLVRVKDADALAQAMQRFIDHPEFIQSMGKRSRELAEEKYDVHKVNAVMLEAMGVAGGQPTEVGSRTSEVRKK